MFVEVVFNNEILNLEFIRRPLEGSFNWSFINNIRDTISLRLHFVTIPDYYNYFSSDFRKNP